MIYDAFNHSHIEPIIVDLGDHILSYDIGTILFNSAVREFYVIQHRV